MFGATRVGVGAIVGGGIFVLAGVAFSTTGPSAVLAFALNGLIAALTILSFAEMSTAFPESGGAYVFGKRVLSVRAAFAVGWILWLAYIVAVVLYTLGFASYGLEMARRLWELQIGAAPGWLTARSMALVLACLAVGGYTVSLIRRTTGGGEWSTIGKVVVFGVLVVGAVWAVVAGSHSRPGATLTPFFSSGTTGLLAAMGFTFIAVQGFDLIPAIGGEIKNPRRNIPRSMFYSLGCAMVIYLPLLLLVAIVGVKPGESIGQLSAANPETVMALAAENYMGAAGLWLVIVAAILSTLSALQANLLAASRVALTMARDRTLPGVLGTLHTSRNTPVVAIYASALTAVIVLLAVPNLAAAGAAASLIFLVAFALVHFTTILARRRGGGREGAFSTPLFPLVPVVGGLACSALAVFQAVAVPSAGLIVVIWLGIGVVFYFGLFATRAEVVDAAAEARDPDLVRLRGRSPLVLVPMANPEHAPQMVAVANALAAPEVGRVLLLSVVTVDENTPVDQTAPSLVSAEKVLRNALSTSIRSGMKPEMLLTIAADPWPEISRVARTHHCESLLLGFTSLTDENSERRLEQLLGEVDCDVSVLAAPDGWMLSDVHRVLVPIAGGGSQEILRARLLASLCRAGRREVTFLTVLPEDASDAAVREARHGLDWLCNQEAMGAGRAEVARSNDPMATITEAAARSDLVILGLQRLGRKRKVFGEFAVRVARTTSGATMMISSGG